MTPFKPTRRGLLATALGLALALSPMGVLVRAARAQDLASAKAAGQLGERVDGYLGVVMASTPADVRAMADAINAKRRAQYEEIAERQGVPVEAVAQIAGQKLLERADPGDWVLGADGQWRQK